MKPAQKQMALKAALFMILAANVSTNFGGNKAAQKQLSFHSSEMASASELGTNRATVPARVEVVAVKPQITIAPAPAALEGAKPDAPVTTATVSVKESTEYRRFCSADFKIRFAQESEAGKNIVRAYVTRRFSQDQFLGLKDEGTYQDLIANADSKSQWDAKIREITIARLKQSGECSDKDSAPQVSPTAPQADEKSERIARGLKNCTLDADGVALTNSDRFDCNLKKLENISLETPDTDDEVVPSDDRHSHRHDHDRKTSRLADVVAAVNPLEASIKTLLMSSKEEKQQDGADHLDDVIQALETVRETASSTSDQLAMDKMIKGLREAYPVGAKLNRDAAQEQVKLSAFDEKLLELKATAASSQNPYQQMAISQQIQFLQQQKMNELQVVNSNADYAKLRTFCQVGYISTVDCSDFASGYNSILRQVQGGNSANLIGGSTVGLATASTDLMNLRNQAVAQDQRNLGLPGMAFPQVNYQLLGLQNPSLAGGQIPAFPQTAQQTSGYPVINNGVPQQGSAYPLFQANGVQPAAGYPQQSIYQQPSMMQPQASMYPQTYGATVPGRTF